MSSVVNLVPNVEKGIMLLLCNAVQKYSKCMFKSIYKSQNLLTNQFFSERIERINLYV